MALLIRKVEDQEEISKIKRLNNYDDENDFSELEELIRRFITATKIYLDPNLTIQNFSKKIHLPSKKVSFIINRCFKGNFHHFINQFRIQEATNIMHNEENVKIEDLYSKVGFNSRSTFNRVFRDFKGVSPSEYIENRKSV
ncbi:MAG: helix-turn-helix domain-containing protein [Melioribacteraceae bacterium]|nr:helix-turn-helix domain-containing protein [Melioribacteraceae bacterium]